MTTRQSFLRVFKINVMSELLISHHLSSYVTENSCGGIFRYHIDNVTQSLNLRWGLFSRRNNLSDSTTKVACLTINFIKFRKITSKTKKNNVTVANFALCDNPFYIENKPGKIPSLPSIDLIEQSLFIYASFFLKWNIIANKILTYPYSLFSTSSLFVLPAKRTTLIDTSFSSANNPDKILYFPSAFISL